MNTVKQVKLKTLALAMAGASMAMPALADEFHYRDILVGDRAAGLGGAYTAISDDASGLYYNPAGIVYSTSTKISGSVNAFNFKNTTYSGISDSNPNQKWTRTSSGMVANFFGVIQPLGAGVAGFSIAIPNYDLEDQSDSFTHLQSAKRLQNTDEVGTELGVNRTLGEANQFAALEQNAIRNQEIDYNNADTTTLAGISYAFPVSEQLSVGMTLYGYMRKKESTLKQISIIEGRDIDDAPVFLKDSYYQKVQTDELGIQPRLGLMWSPIERVSIGMMIQTTIMLSESPDTRLDQTLCTGTQCYTLEGSNFVALDTNAHQHTDIGLNETTKNKLPTEVNLGLAYFPSNALLLTGDFSYATSTDRYAATWNLAGGAEYFLNPTWAVRGGLYTNNANTESNVSVHGDPHINEIGSSFSVTRYTKTSNITVGLGYLGGTGTANLFGSSSHTQEIKTFGMNLYVSTSGSF
ncbi:OmpP1/FadL family transporter [Thiomicrospira microaerophila]|uniref:OmpP1/FadL family transporter n=1 Tax=Thiomicrospira microaerophila TaxID=406020 RepID=UPI0005C8AD3B|nr:outer membrane protein transport protein [Thiomicrospira microaerophila]